MFWIGIQYTHDVRMKHINLDLTLPSILPDIGEYPYKKVIK